MIHGSVAVEAASALMVSCTGSNDGCRAAARVQPPIMATGAAIADASAQRGTVMEGLPSASGRVGDWVRDRPPRRMGRFEDDFDGPDLDPAVWLPHYLPAWSSRAQTAASYELRDSCLHLSHPARRRGSGAPTTTCRRCACRASSPATSPARSAAPAGSSRTATGSWCARRRRRSGAGPRRAGYIELRARAVVTPRSMVAFWLVGLEDEPERCAEICVTEVFGDAVEPGSAAVGDRPAPVPRPRPWSRTSRRSGCRSTSPSFHTYAVDWSAEQADVPRRRRGGAQLRRVRRRTRCS